MCTYSIRHSIIKLINDCLAHNEAAEVSDLFPAKSGGFLFFFYLVGITEDHPLRS